MDVLFLCSGNYYRSRFAEELYRARIERSSTRAKRGGGSDGVSPSGGPNEVRALSTIADVGSAGLLEACERHNILAMSPHAIQALAERGVTVRDPRPPRDVTEELLAGARLIIALHEPEHRPMVARRFPSWTDRIRYWRVADIDVTPPAIALAEIERLVLSLC